MRIVSPGFHAFRMQSEADDYAEQAGITVDVDFELDPDARLALGEVDLGALPAPGAVVGRGDEGELIDLLHWFDREALRDQLSDPMLALGSDGPDGAIWGLPFGLNLKSAIWYPIPEFHEAGYEVPTTWSELVELCDQMVADGRTPWGMAETLGGATGWPSTDWIEDLVLHDLGPEAYDDWVAHEIRFDDPRIRRAFERYAELLLGEGRIHNGPEAAITTNLEVGMRPLAADPPECWLMHLPSFATQWFGDLGVRPHEDLDVLSTPALSAAGDNTVLGGGGYLAAWSDRPEVREAMRRLVGPDFGHTMYGSEEAGEWVFSANADFSLDAYNNPAQRTMAAEVRDAVELDRFRFDGSDLMPVPVSDAFWEAMVMFLQDGPDNLDDVLAHVEAAWDAWEASGDGTSTG